MQRPYIISIEGNIGSGKTTLIDRLQEVLPKNVHKFVFLREPVPVWESVQDANTGENILQKYYSDPSKYAFPFQVLAYMSFYNQLTDAIKNAGENTVIICERSMQSSRAIFAKMLKEDGIIEDINYKILEMFYGQTVEIHLDAIIYLDVDVVTCNERINKRGRPGEGNIPLEYLEKCGKYHDDWLHTVKPSPSGTEFMQFSSRAEVADRSSLSNADRSSLSNADRSSLSNADRSSLSNSAEVYSSTIKCSMDENETVTRISNFIEVVLSKADWILQRVQLP